jgi:hypothetical protein
MNIIGIWIGVYAQTLEVQGVVCLRGNIRQDMVALRLSKALKGDSDGKARRDQRTASF